MNGVRWVSSPPWNWWQVSAPGFVLTQCAGRTWFRLFGYGLALTDTRQTRPSFSVRNRLKRVLWIGPVFVEVLRP